MEILIWILLLVGIAGAVLPMLPGPIFSSSAAILAMFHLGHWSDVWLWAWAILGLVVFFADYIMPGIIAKMGGASKLAARGANIGLIIGLIFGPGFILGALLGAFVGEYVDKTSVKKSLRSSLLATLGVFTGMFMKVLYTLIVTGVVIFELYI